MLIQVTEILGIGGVPNDRSSAGRWLERNQINLQTSAADHRRTKFVRVFDLPSSVQKALLEAELPHHHVEPGEWDDAAHSKLRAASPSRRERAERKAAIARRIAILKQKGVLWADIRPVIVKEFGGKGTSMASLKAIYKAVEGVDPINLVVAPELEFAGLALLNSEAFPNLETNPYKGTANLIVTPYLPSA